MFAQKKKFTHKSNWGCIYVISDDGKKTKNELNDSGRLKNTSRQKPQSNYKKMHNLNSQILKKEQENSKNEKEIIPTSELFLNSNDSFSSNDDFFDSIDLEIDSLNFI